MILQTGESNSYLRRARWFALLQVTLLFGVHAAFAGDKSDVVVMKNGDHLTGDIKRLENGVLYLEPRYTSDPIGLNWESVASVSSKSQFRVTLSSGQHYIGTFKRNEDVVLVLPVKVSPENEVAPISVASTEVISLTTQKVNFWRQLTGSVDFGFGYTSGNGQKNEDFSSTLGYRSTSWDANSSFDSSYSAQSGGSTTNRLELEAGYNRYLPNNNLVNVVSDTLHSAQQDLDVRTTIGAGFGHYIIRHPTNTLSAVAGLAYSYEAYTVGSTDTPDGNNLEGLLGAQQNLIKFNRYQLNVTAFLFPGITDFGRVRLTDNVDFTVKLENNFHFTVSQFDTFDSRPPQSAKKNELGFSTSLGYTF